jgi:O-antigen/teichoic acid export membrane protein
MSRFRRVIHSVASGYVVLAFGSIYSLASVPLALHYLVRADQDLGKKEFALWILLTQVSGYLSLIDLGMTGSVSRLLIDYKDEKRTGTYGSLIRTGWLVLLVQGFVVAAVGALLAPFFTGLLKIEPAMVPQFIKLLRYQSGILGLSFAVRMFGQILYAHQRQDLMNYAQLIQLAAGFTGMWLGFIAGQGVYSVIWSGTAMAIASGLVQAGFCWRLKLFPGSGEWGPVRWNLFKELFAYGKDLFLIGIGSQLIMASQTIIISRNEKVLGLAMVGLWGVGTKMFSLVSQLLYRVWDFAGPGFSEMIARREKEVLRGRYQTLVTLAGSLSGWAAITYVVCNHSFVAVWTHGRFEWPCIYDLLLAAWLVELVIGHCHNVFFMWTKKVGRLWLVYMIEGVSFFLLASVVSKYWGLAGMIASSILCNTFVSLAYGLVRISRYFGFPLKVAVWTWHKPMLAVIALFAPLAAGVWWLVRDWAPLPQLIISAAASLVVGGLLFLRFGVVRDFQRELLARAPRRLNPILRHVFVRPSAS